MLKKQGSINLNENFSPFQILSVSWKAHGCDNIVPISTARCLGFPRGVHLQLQLKQWTIPSKMDQLYLEFDDNFETFFRLN